MTYSSNPCVFSNGDDVNTAVVDVTMLNRTLDKMSITDPFNITIKTRLPATGPGSQWNNMIQENDGFIFTEIFNTR